MPVSLPVRSLLLQLTDRGLYCAPGDFYVDPWAPVDRAVITHAHSDHARWGSARYLIAAPGLAIAQRRLGFEAEMIPLEYGKPIIRNGVSISFHPAGHILGSAQVRIEYRGEVWVVSGDYKIDKDPTCAPFEPVRCHTFITEATFGLPIYRWPQAARVFEEVDAWWRDNQAAGKASVLFAYALGKAQRLLAGVDASIGPIYAHGAVQAVNDLYRASGVALPETRYAGEAPRDFDWSQALIIAPTSARDTPWLRRFGRFSDGFASGWMRVRGQRRRRSVDRGFVLSDHVDWPRLMLAVRESGAERVFVTHGYTAVVARWLTEQGLEAHPLETRYAGDEEEGDAGNELSVADASSDAELPAATDR
jgi:putative mRNA 3-end processing factor